MARTDIEIQARTEQAQKKQKEAAELAEFASLEEKLQADVELVEAFIETVNKESGSPEIRATLGTSVLTE